MSVEKVLTPKDAGKWISENSDDVKINSKGVKKLADQVYDLLKMKDQDIQVDRWQLHILNPKTKDRAAVDWVFLSDVLNFSFWAEEGEKCEIEFAGKRWTGYLSFCAAINRALQEGIPFTDPAYYSKITREQLQHILRSDSDYAMPMLEERLENLHADGKVIMEKYGGTYANVIKESKGSAQNLVQIVLRDFPSFRDEAIYKGRKVAIWKRVQILVADTWACCSGEGLGNFDDIGTLTMFADYRIPQALYYFGVLEYTDEFMKKLKNKTMLTNGERQEVEIRGCSIWAVELVVEVIKQTIAEDEDMDDNTIVNAALIDHFLWDLRQKKAKETAHVPFHRVRCIYY